jgi:DNA-binding MarR family transcriptional regulator
MVGRLEVVPAVRYDVLRMAKVMSTRDLAAEAWRPLARFFFETSQHRAEILRSHGLTPNDAKALWALEPEHGQTMRALADRWVCDASNATWIVDRLEERGLAERRADPSDRRVKLVVLTPSGVEARRRLQDLMFEPPPELLALDRSDLEALRDALAKLPTSGT